MGKFRVTLLTFYCSDEIEADTEQEALNEFEIPKYFDINEPHKIIVEEMDLP